jgi:heme-degrading monooxygenase HmoA
MYVSINTLHIQPDGIDRIAQCWAAQVESSLNQLDGLIDLYLLCNVEQATVLLVTIYTDEAAALAAQSSAAYQQPLGHLAARSGNQPIVYTGYAVLST